MLMYRQIVIFPVILILVIQQYIGGDMGYWKWLYNEIKGFGTTLALLLLLTILVIILVIPLIQIFGIIIGIVLWYFLIFFLCSYFAYHVTEYE